MKGLAILGALALLGMSGSARSAPGQPDRGRDKAESCSGMGDLHFVCGVSSVEDLVAIRGGRYLVGSSYKPGSAGLYLIDTAARTARPVTLSIATRRDPRLGDCPPPDLQRLQTHGLAAKAARDGGITIYAVNHGGRESIELFRLDPGTGAAAWTGCLLLPKGASGNAVVPLADGRIAISKFDDAGDPHGIETVIAGKITGLVYIWTPGHGFSILAHSRLSGPNGLAASADGKWLFVNAYGGRAIWRLPLSGSGRREKADVPFLPDNLRWAADGNLLVTGQFVQPGPLDMLHDWATVRLDPRTMAVMPVIREHGLPEFDSATTAVEAGGAMWFGSFRGDRVAYRPLIAR